VTRRLRLERDIRQAAVRLKIAAALRRLEAGCIQRQRNSTSTSALYSDFEFRHRSEQHSL